MTTIIRLDTSFNNPNLPVFLPIPERNLLGAWFLTGEAETIFGDDLTITGTANYEATHLPTVNSSPIVNTKIADASYDEMTMVFIGNIGDTTSVQNNHAIGNFSNDGCSLYMQTTGGVRLLANGIGTEEASVNGIDTTIPKVYFATRTQNGLRLRIPSDDVDVEVSSVADIVGKTGFVNIGYYDVGASFDIYGAAIYSGVMTDAEVASAQEGLEYHFGRLGVDLS